MELEDCGFDLLQDVVVTSDASVAFKGVRRGINLSPSSVLNQCYRDRYLCDARGVPSWTGNGAQGSPG